MAESRSSTSGGGISAQYAFAKGRLTEVFNALFEFFVVPVDLLLQPIEGVVGFHRERLELLAEFTEHVQGMVDRFTHVESSVQMINLSPYLYKNKIPTQPFTRTSHGVEHQTQAPGQGGPERALQARCDRVPARHRAPAGA